eukprot:361300-Chlamydomonas_euryale.AAC.1
MPKCPPARGHARPPAALPASPPAASPTYTPQCPTSCGPPARVPASRIACLPTHAFKATSLTYDSTMKLAASMHGVAGCKHAQ